MDTRSKGRLAIFAWRVCVGTNPLQRGSCFCGEPSSLASRANNMGCCLGVTAGSPSDPAGAGANPATGNGRARTEIVIAKVGVTETGTETATETETGDVKEEAGRTRIARYALH